MLIRDMFHANINRRIDGVIKIDQDKTDTLRQEVSEYVITREFFLSRARRQCLARNKNPFKGFGVTN